VRPDRIQIEDVDLVVDDSPVAGFVLWILNGDIHELETFGYSTTVPTTMPSGGSLQYREALRVLPAAYVV
jgi:hypothetical protein